jgi:hypothetical protein
LIIGSESGIDDQRSDVRSTASRKIAAVSSA